MAEQPHLSPEAYARAERLLEANVGRLVFNTSLEPHWLPGGGFWYRRESREGSSFVRVDPASGRAAAAFDHEGLARSLTSQGHPCTATTLPFARIGLGAEATPVAFELAGQQWHFDGTGCKPLRPRAICPRPMRSARRMGDGSCCGWRTIFVLRDVASGTTRRLTEDGTAVAPMPFRRTPICKP